MKRFFAPMVFCLAFGALGCFVSLAHAEDDSPTTDAAADQSNAEKDKGDVKAEAAPAQAAAAAHSAAEKAQAPAPKPKYPPFADVMKDFKPIDGLIKLYRNENKLYAELPSNQFDRDFIVLISIARGMGERPILGGMSWMLGDDDWIWQFRLVDDNVHIVRRNVRFRAAKGSPQEKAVELAYTDSVLFSLPVITKSPSGAVIVDLGQVFMSDLPQISRVLSGFSFASNKSNWASVKGFKDNVELQVAATYASGGTSNFDTVADSRGVSINVHYSISLLPNTGYQPRMADDRVGHFLSVIKDYSKPSDDDRFVRYINRWDLQKADPKAAISPPKKPIVFWIENTVPYEYRGAIREGILEWNKAFEKAGFSDAIEVRQQPDNADWDPEDINYNTFRWITSSAGFAMGPSRVNPKTGQILDADIIFDADFVQFWKREYETFTPESIAALTGGALDIPTYQAELHKSQLLRGDEPLHCCELHHGMARDLSMANSALAAKLDPATAEKEQRKLILQGLKEVTMHEVGHTLGLRHNFKASTMLSLEELNDVEKTRETGTSASVMDYTPANIVPKDVTQGDYYTTTVGPYDMWAIEYAYKSLQGGTDGEMAELKKIASRDGEPGLVYATDEDTRGIDPDPYSNRFDLGKDPLDYAKQRTRLARELMPDVVDRATKEGDGYQRARQAFGVLLGNYGQAAFFASRYIGGLEVSRDHKGDADAKEPFTVIPAEKQREALSLVEDLMLNGKPFDLPPELYNRLASTYWDHWGVKYPMRTDYPVHEVIAMWQERVLDQLLSSLTLTRLHDSELKVPEDEDAFTTAELLSRLTKSIFAEVDDLKPGEYTDRKPAISSLRRNLQRIYLKRLATMALGDGGMPSGGARIIIMGTGGGSSIPEDCQTMAYAELTSLKARLDQAIKKNKKLDAYSKAHLDESRDRIAKVLDARLTFSKP